jgi:DNA invertase Pin-like site-specific DNA recombinase
VTTTNPPERPTFAFYGRVSTEENQDPESSRGWQLDHCTDVVEALGGEIVAEYFDENVSRAEPWSGRPHASRLLRDIRDPGRRFDNVIIAEPARGFSDDQYSAVSKVFRDTKITLYVASIGRIDPEHHDMQMVMAGVQAKSERNTMRYRVRRGMKSAVRAGLTGSVGGRDPYGYESVPHRPHRNPKKAKDGKMETRYEVVAEEATVVRRIFEMYLGGDGYRAIAQALTDDDIPCPSAADREHNLRRDGTPLRHGLSWDWGTVREILRRPVYTGYSVTGRTRKVDVLKDIDAPSKGDRIKQTAVPREQWVWSPDPTHEPIVSLEAWEAVQTRMEANAGGRSPRRRRPNADDRHYLFAGRIRCEICGKGLEGNPVGKRLYYRCRFHRSSANTPRHPNCQISEDVVADIVDRWIAELFEPSHREEVVAVLLEAAGDSTSEVAIQIERERSRIRTAKNKLEKCHRLLAEDVDPAVLAGWIREATAEREVAEAALRELQRDQPAIDEAAIRSMLDALGEARYAMIRADRPTRKALYASLGLALRFDPTTRTLHASQDLGGSWGYGSVGGASSTVTPRRLGTGRYQLA